MLQNLPYFWNKKTPNSSKWKTKKTLVFLIPKIWQVLKHFSFLHKEIDSNIWSMEPKIRQTETNCLSMHEFCVKVHYRFWMGWFEIPRRKIRIDFWIFRSFFYIFFHRAKILKLWGVFSYLDGTTSTSRKKLKTYTM